MADRERFPLRGDETELFRSYNAELMRRVRASVHASDEILEDACAFAWFQFMRCQPDRNRNWRGWLVSVARHEAWSLSRDSRETIHFSGPDRDDPQRGVPEPADVRDPLAIRDDLEEAVTLLKGLPPRLKQAAFLRAVNLRYDEISEVTGDSPTRVGQLIAAANLRIRDQIAERHREGRSPAPRAQRLAELERNPPAWLTSRIGAVPNPHRKVGRAHELLEWRRAALAIDDYRREYEPNLAEAHPEHRPQGPMAMRAWGRVVAAIRRVEAHRERDMERGHE